jgi:conjugal transfer pilus assembly protein TraD
MPTAVSLDTLWREAHEVYAVIAWLVAAFIMTMLALLSGVAFETITWVIALTAWTMAIVRSIQVYRLWEAKITLAGVSDFKMTSEQLVKKMRENDDMFWAGKGFTWLAEHTQRLYEIKRINLKMVMPPEWVCKIKGVPSFNNTRIGDPTLHGVESQEIDIMAPMKHFEGHAIIFGLPGSGKTTWLRLICHQAIHRGDVLIVIDPKGDAELEKCCRNEAARAGRPDDYAYFHLAHPERSVRIDPLRNWNRPTELASRIKAILPASDPNDPFTNYAWGVMNRICMGMIFMGERPNLKAICRNVEIGIEPLLTRCIEKFLRLQDDNWEVALLPYLNRKRDPKGQKQSAMMTPRLIALIENYEEVFVAAELGDETINGLLAQIRHDRSHSGKMLASSLPTLIQLTSGEVGELLSPDASDMDDDRPILDSKKIINGRKILYMGLDALPDPTVAGAVGSISLADIVSVAGDRYNYGVDDARIIVVVDELSDVVNDQLTQLVGKGRGSGFSVFACSQNFPDFVARLGDEPKARKFLGNFNNAYFMRSNDKMTQEYAVETFGESVVSSVLVSHSSGVSSEAPVNLSGGFGARNSETLEATVPADVLGRLPNFHYFGQMSGGRIVKGRIPILQD